MIKGTNPISDLHLKLKRMGINNYSFDIKKTNYGNINNMMKAKIKK